MEMMTPMAPPTMNGRRLPQRLRVRSLNMPTRGWTITPHNGAAIHTSAVNDLESPREIKYGLRSISKRLTRLWILTVDG